MEPVTQETPGQPEQFEDQPEAAMQEQSMDDEQQMAAQPDMDDS